MMVTQMTMIINKYVGISHPLGKTELDDEELDLILNAWKNSNCPQGFHLWDEVWSIDSHYLHCDACGMEIHIDHIVVPDGKDDIIGERKNNG